MRSILSKLRNRLSPSLSYGILKPCYRCVYGKSHEPILFFSMHRGPRVIINFDHKAYTRKGECIGFKECTKCFDQISSPDPSLPCKWVQF